MAFELGDRVILKDRTPGRVHVGIVVRIDDQDTIGVHWSGSDTPLRPFRYAPLALELWEPED